MISAYKFDSIDPNCLYINIHQNIVSNFDRPNKKNDENNGELTIRIFNNDTVSKKIINDICEHILKSKNDGYFLDFNYIKADDGAGTFSELNKLLKKNLNIIIFNVFSDLQSKIVETECLGNSILVADGLITNNCGKKYYESLLDKYQNDMNMIFDKLNSLRKSLIISFYKEQIKKDDKVNFIKLRSSNIYSNIYLDLKKMFNDYQKYSLIVYELCSIIDKNFLTQNVQKLKIDGLICSSNNGLALATIIGQLLEIDVEYLINVGPDLSIKDRDYIDRIKKGKNYIYIYDFMCLGTEYKITEFILNFKKANLISSVGIAVYVEPNRFEEEVQENKTIYRIFNTNDQPHNFNYEICGMYNKEE